MNFLRAGLLLNQAGKRLEALPDPMFDKTRELALHLSRAFNFEDRIKPVLNDKSLSESGKRQKKREVALQIISEAQKILEQFRAESKVARDTLKRRTAVKKPDDAGLTVAQAQLAALLADAPREPGKFGERLNLLLESARKDGNSSLLWLLQSSFVEALAKMRPPEDIAAHREIALRARERLVEPLLRPYVRLEAAAAESLPEIERLLSEAVVAYRHGLQSAVGPLDPGGVAVGRET